MFGLRKYVVVYVVVIAPIVCTMTVDAQPYYEREVTLTCLLQPMTLSNWSNKPTVFQTSNRFFRNLAHSCHLGTGKNFNRSLEHRITAINNTSSLVQNAPILPSHLHDITDTSTFRKRLKNVLFDRAYN